jgi:L-alanine-DL-glutamate epimerase-like enolase superfamily enzyme
VLRTAASPRPSSRRSWRAWWPRSLDVAGDWEDLYNRIVHGTIGMAMATPARHRAVDIMGRAVNKPVHKLIGGAHRSEVVLTPPAHFHRHDRLVEEAVEKPWNSRMTASAPSR